MVEHAWVQTNFNSNKTLSEFVDYVQRQCLNKYGRDQITQALVDLGLRYPRGPEIKNEGTHKKSYFSPHALWEGDGKHLKIILNGQEFTYCWYAFIDQNTTLLAGSSLTAAESPAAFLKGLRDGKDNVGFFPMGVLIDNRLTHEDKVAVKQFCKEQGIVLVNTFPGNAKSNGIIEGNFSIFEKQVGAIHVRGETAEEIAQSLAHTIIEIFTQQRNHNGRKRLNLKTPHEATIGSTRPECEKEKLEKLRDRLLRNELCLEAKVQLIEDLFKNFEPMSEESRLKFNMQLKQFSPHEIISAKARFLAQQAKHPDALYRSEYFMGILRNKAEEMGKDAYSEAFRVSTVALNEIVKTDLKTKDLPQLAKKIVAFLAMVILNPCKSHLLMSVDSLCWGLNEFVSVHKLPELWEEIVQAIRRSRDITLVKWQVIAEFIHERLGIFLYQEAPPPIFAGPANKLEMQM